MAQMARLMESAMAFHEHPLPDLELSQREVRVLILLGERGEMIMTELASAIRVPLSTLTRIVDRLQKKELLNRSRSEADRRIVVVKQRKKGKLLHAAFKRHQRDLVRRMLEPLSSGEREAFLELMAKLLAGLREPPAEGPPAERGALHRTVR
jgi:DNA-binding MarR family transcriptional regulator